MAFSSDASSDRSLMRRLALLIRWVLAQRPFRFLLVGGLNTLFGYGLFTAFYLTSHMRQSSLVAATVFGVLFNFFTTGRLVFANRGFKTMVPFFLGYGMVLLVNMALLEVLVRAGVATLVAQAITLPLVVALSYLINRYAVFARDCRSGK